MEGESNMPTIKILRNGQLTLPAKLRKALDLEEGDFLNAELKEDKIILRPAAVVEKRKIEEGARKRFFKLIEENWKKNKDLNSKQVKKIVNEAVKEVREKRVSKAK